MIIDAGTSNEKLGGGGGGKSPETIKKVQERERPTDRRTDRERDTQRETDRDRETGTETDRERQR